MSDPFSIATGVAGLISLGLTVCDGLHTYFSAIKDRKDDIAIATQSLALFKFHVFAIQSSASKLGHRHSPTIDGLQLSLINCEMQLKRLESLLTELMPTKDPSLAKEIWRRQKLIARYPFDRKKLVQLEEYLSRANTTLSSFIQALNLDINIRMSDDLEAFKSSLEALDINTQTTLRTISTRLDFIRPKVEPSILEVLSSRTGDRVTTTTSNNLTNAHSTPRYLQNAELEQRLCRKLADMDCTCGASNSKTSNRPASRTYRFWGGLTVSRQGDASPFDVDQDGNNIAHMCLNACLYSFSFEEALKSSDIAIDAICKMLTYLADIGVPITASNFNQSNLLTLSIKSFRNLWVLPSLYKLVMNRDSNFYHSELAHNGPLTANLWFENGGKWARQLDTLCEYPEICEDIGFSELFLAVIKKDHARLQAILAEEDSISNISQMDLYKRNILHASSNWPDGLRLLLQRQDVRPLMDMGPEPFFHPRPLDYALFYSKIYCNAPDQWTECDNCTCYVAVQLLLEADCSVTVGHGRPEILAGCSLKARKLFFKHLKDRRERLRNVALGILPKETLRQYGITANFLPDKTAPMLWNELQEAKGQRDRLVGLTNSLQPCSDRFSIQPKSLFEFPHYLQVAELALDYGLVPKDEKGVPTLLSGSYIVPNSLLGRLAEEVSMKYLDWLLRHDLNLELSLEPFRFSTLHRAAVFVGLRIFWSSRRVKRFDLLHQDVSICELQDSKILLPAICESKAQCNIPCPCSSSMFNRPLAHILPAMLRYRGDSHLTYSFSHIGEPIKLVVRSIDLLRLSECSSEHSYMAKCAIHILTMMSLGVRHLPICLTENYDDLEDLEGKEDWKEILDEDRELIDRLQALDEEFGEEFDLQDVSIAEFLRGYWVTRMEEVLGELNKPLTDDDRYDLWEAGVVLKEDDIDGPECCVEYTEDEI
ncbi:hypothetical protein FOXG_15819 [Fusarium oxysporum f. sp. lycopersici 4287]|uniref:Fungal N-terminal domain-containing protein n=2 Tax=Fusarium oxysporum TaxID=5507 RepID=A0A0J9W5R2_FUSO4|nr:hypothetical protein FOXG_15819 [Fusarium oxysporum f. sp. lycopersici 4287]EXK26691.1 hypothetical protein FOMG_16752 [Fusarium oxysporum f. sp. melonis 26406]KNB18193.1 hypothetical protein FOXG_15819 [Fusarium oxysporum f. sp. lycopersici 4287]